MTTPDVPQPQDRLPEHPPTTPVDHTFQPPMPVIGETPATGHDPALVGRVVPGAPAEVPAALPAPESSIVAVFGDTRREGVWRVPAKTTAWSFLGDVRLDLREAVFDAPVTEFAITSVMGDVTLVVAPGTEVQFRGFSLLGDRKIKDLTETGVRAPVTRTIVVTASGLMGDVTVKIVEPGREVPRWWTARKRR